MSLTLITAPAVEPVTLAQMKLQCGFGPFEDSDQLREQTLAEQLRAAITAARQHVENVLARALITQTWTYTLDHFPYENAKYQNHHGHDIVLPLPKFQALDAFTYIDSAGNVQDMMAPGSWGYQLVSGGDTTPAKLRPPLFRYWPPTEYTACDTVVITFTSGYGATGASVPTAILSAIKIAAQHIFENRPGSFPTMVDMLLAPYTNLIA